MLLRILFSTVLAHAAEPVRLENAVSLRADYGASDYHQIDFRGKFRLDDAFDGAFGVLHERELHTGSAGALRAQLGFRPASVLHARAAFLYQMEPNAINGFGFDGGLDWTANPRDENEHETILSLDYATTTFRQKGVPSDPAVLLAQRFLRRQWVFRWAQEVSESFSTLLFAEIDSYASAQGNLVNTATDFHRRPLADGNGMTAGFQHWSAGLALRFQLTDDWRLGIDGARAEIYNVATLADTFAADLSYQIDNDWWLGGHAGTSRQDQRNTIAFGGLSLRYEF